MQLVQCLNEAHSVLAKLAIEKVSYLSSPVVLGIAALCDFVKKTVLTEVARSQCSHLTHLTSLCVQDRMKVQGWCPTNVERLSSGLDVASLCLVAAQPHPDPEKNHSRCELRKCDAYQVEEGKYVREHAPGCDRSKCKDLIVESEELHRTLLSGSIPLTRYIEESAGDCDIQVVPAEPGTRYVAISHVWSDGFGNPEGNALFSCQAKRIAMYVAAAMGSPTTDVPFWIDTLSCPVKPDEATDLAISMMRETYADAARTVVMSSHLLIRKKPALCLEVLALIISSSWTRRLWTLQEGVLAKDVVFQFEDESIDFETAIALTQLELQQFLEPESLEYAALLNMATMLHDLWGARNQTLSENLLTLLHSELQWRSTSVPSDEPLCVSALLGFPLRDIMSVCVDCRKAHFWTMVKHPPRRILFWSGKRLNTPGFRWAPDSLLAMSDAYFLEALPPTSSRVPKFDGPDQETAITDDGLIVGGDALMLGEWVADISKGFFLNPVPGPLLWVTRHRNSRMKTVISNIAAPGPRSHTGSQARHLSLLLQKPGKYLLSPTRQGAVSALLLSHQKPDGDKVIQGTIEDVCSVFPAYFLTDEQKQVVDDTWEQCMKALDDAERPPPPASEIHPSDQAATTESNTQSMHGNLPRHLEHTRSDGEHFYVSKGADGLRQIEWNGAIWWTECSALLLNQSWCLD